MDPKARCHNCNSECETVGGNLWCENCKSTIFIFYDEWGSDEFFNSDMYKRMQKFILSSIAANMQEDSHREQEELLRRETYARNMLEDDDLGKQTVFPDTLELIISSYHKYKKE